MLWSSLHPLKHDMNVSTELHPLNTSAGIDLIFVPENVIWKFSHFVLLAKSPAGISVRPVPVNAILKVSQSFWLRKIPAGIVASASS